MDKKTFLLKLRHDLSVLEEEELQDIISEYEQHIDMKVENGLTQEEAIADFGSMTELTAEILEAYHVRADYAEPSSGKRGKGERGYGNSPHKISDDFQEENRPAEIARKWKERIKRLVNTAGTGISAVGASAKRGVIWGKRQISRPFLWIWGMWKNREKSEGRENRFRRSQKKKRNTRRYFMERREYGEDRQGILSIIGGGIRQTFRGCIEVILWCIRLGWNICCVGASLLVGAFGLFCLYGLGVLLVLLLQGYPLLGVTLGCLGLVLCMFSLACFGFTLRWTPKKQVAKNKHPEENVSLQRTDGEEEEGETEIFRTEQENSRDRSNVIVETEGEQHA